MSEDYIAVPGLPSAALGAIVYWRINGSTKLEDLQESWERARLPSGDLPVEVAAETALRLACQEQKQKRRLVRPLQDGRGYAIVEETAEGDDLSHRVAVRVKLVPCFWTDSPERLIAHEIRASYERHLNEIHAAAFGSWLVKRVTDCSAVSLRDTGGIYFIPRHGMAHWRRIATAIREASPHQLFEIPAMKSDEAVLSIVDALTSEATAEMEALREELAGGELGGRALKSRQAACQAVSAKVAEFSALLGIQMSVVASQLTQLEAEITAAQLAAEAAEEAKK